MPLTSLFARVRMHAAHHDQLHEDEWLIIEWPRGGQAPVHCWLSNLPANVPWQPMPDTGMRRLRVEREYRELKQEL